MMSWVEKTTSTVNAFSTTVNVSDLPNGIYVVKINALVIVRKVQIMR